jgi:hypothetical protein
MSAVGYSGGVGMDRFHGYRTDGVGGHGVADDQRGNMGRKRLLLWLRRLWLWLWLLERGQNRHIQQRRFGRERQRSDHRERQRSDHRKSQRQRQRQRRRGRNK